MNRLLLGVLALLLTALGWQTWRLADASQTISTQADELQSKSRALAKSNNQLISLSILTETNNRGAGAALCRSRTDQCTAETTTTPD